jgi:AP-1-like factor
MADFSSLYGQNLYLSPEQQDLLMAALSSNNTGQQHGDKKSSRGNTNGTSGSTNDNSPSHQSNGFDPGSTSYFESPLQEAPGSANLGFGSDESPYLDFDPDLDFDPQSEDNMIGDLPDFGNSDEHELGDKRKSLDGMDDDLENGRKRRESDDSKSAKKPGRKPLTSEPTSVWICGGHLLWIVN